MTEKNDVSSEQQYKLLSVIEAKPLGPNAFCRMPLGGTAFHLLSDVEAPVSFLLR